MVVMIRGDAGIKKGVVVGTGLRVKTGRNVRDFGVGDRFTQRFSNQNIPSLLSRQRR